MAKLKSGTRIYGTATIDTSVVVGSAVTLSSSGVNVTGISTLNNANATQLQVTGVSTFTNGPLLIGSATSTGTASQRLQVTGGAYFSGTGGSANVGVGTTNPQYIFTVTDTGTSATVGLTNCLADFTTTANSYGQINLRNTSSGTNASGDIVITADNGNDSTNFIDLGINNSGFSVGSWTINGANDGYLYTSDGNLSIGAINASVPKYISFFTGGSLISNERMRINATGVGIGTTNPTSKLDVVGDARISGVVTATGGFNIGIQSGGINVTTGVVTALNFVGSGNTFSYNSTTKTIDISIQGGGGGGGSTSSGDGTAFNTGITSATFARLTGIGSTVLTIPSTAGKEYIIYSINAANIAIGNTEVNVIGAFDFNGGERSYFSYNIPVPTGTSIELLKQPQILNPSDKIVMRSTDYNRDGIDTGVEVYITYQEVTSTSYFGVGLGTVGIATTASTTAYTASSASIVQSIRLTNRTDTGAYPISVFITSGVTTTYLVDNLIVPKYASVELLDTPKRLNQNAVLSVQEDQTQTIDVQISGKVIT